VVLDLLHVERPQVFRGVPHADEPPRAHHQVDLPALEPADRCELAVVDGDMEVVAVPHELRGLVRVDQRVGDHVGEPKLPSEAMEVVG